ncbi:MAG: hypothetical protein RBT16_05550, partial [Desulfococcus multivorans]|nr:hypothetical protein [Desulfococcus multivorans]
MEKLSIQLPVSIEKAWELLAQAVDGVIGGVSRGTARRAPTRRPPAMKEFGCPAPDSLPTIVRSFKSAAAKRISELRQTLSAKLRQRNYFCARK